MAADNCRTLARSVVDAGPLAPSQNCARPPGPSATIRDPDRVLARRIVLGQGCLNGLKVLAQCPCPTGQTRPHHVLGLKEHDLL